MAYRNLLIHAFLYHKKHNNTRKCFRHTHMHVNPQRQGYMATCVENGRAVWGWILTCCLSRDYLLSFTCHTFLISLGATPRFKCQR